MRYDCVSTINQRKFSMQISFDPLVARERALVTLIMSNFVEDLGTGGNSEFVGGTLGEGMAAAGMGTDATGQDNRSAASVFAGAAPLSGVQLGAGATPLDNAQGATPGSLAPLQPGLPGLAQTPASTGAPLANAGAGSPAGGVELDSQGIPWHHEIHASTKSKTKTGEWVKKRGLNDEAKYNRIVAELKMLHAMPAAGGAPLTAVAQPGAQPAATTPGAGTLPQGLPPLMPLQQAAPTVPQNFDEMMPRLTAAIAAGIAPQGVLEQACAARQLPGIVALVSRPDFVPVIWGDIKNAYPAIQ